MNVQVIVSAYNHARYITQAIDSVMDQKINFDLEVVVLDDYSSDDTRRILLGLQKQYPDQLRLEFSDTNRNDDRTFVEEIQQSTAKYIALLDGDDYWSCPRKLQKQVDFLERHPECAICFHNAEKVFEDSSHMNQLVTPVGYDSVFSIDSLLSGCDFWYGSAMVRGGINIAFPDWYFTLLTSDWALFILYAEQGKCGYIPDVMGKYRRHDAGMWSSLTDVDRWIGNIDFLDVLIDHMGSLYQSRLRVTRSNFCFALAKVYAKQDDVLNARIWLRESLVNRPWLPLPSARGLSSVWPLLKIGWKVYLSRR